MVDFKFDLAIGHSAGSRTWKNKNYSWSQFLKKICQPYHTKETLKEFLGANKTDQLKIKDVGGYFGGFLRNGRRNPVNVMHRQLLTLDLDFAHEYFWEDFTFQYECAAILHSTHKHTAKEPRYRLLIPLDREVSADEYTAISRKVAGNLGIQFFDNTTFEINRLMFWPSTPVDQVYYCEVQNGDQLRADDVLSEYTDWTDSSSWPTNTEVEKEIKAKASKQEDPETKKGVIGAFCRAYDIHTAIETFLKDDYVECGIENRYTYSKGSAAAGLVVYEDKFAFSHHGTDPSSQKLCNAFDLVRLHLFGHLDEGAKVNGMPASFKAMEDFANKDKSVKKLIASEAFEIAKNDFDTPFDDDDTEEINIEWAEELEAVKGAYTSCSKNIDLILENDPWFKGKFKQNEFDFKRYITGSLPWRKVTRPEPVKNVDYSGIRNYIERVYGINSSLKVDDSLALAFEKHSYHPVRDFLTSQKWDKIQRVDTLLVDYFGAIDNQYTREAIRKMLVGAVARIMQPGIKFDLVLTLVGDQGTGKSTFINKLGGAWFSDTFMSVQGKEALEQIQGAWLIEIAELAGLRKADVESIKHFISKQEDTFRPAYGRTSETYRRQCVFFATTNSKDFLKDPSGNRRFLPIDVNGDNVKKSVWDDLGAEEVAQIWAEAYQMYVAGEPLYLSKDAEKGAKSEQIKHSELDERTGLIEEYLEKKLSKDWDDKDIFERRMFLNDPINAEGIEPRRFVCIAEIWCECLGKEKEDMSRYNTRELNDIMRGLHNWEGHISTKNFKLYGKQKYYELKKR